MDYSSIISKENIFSAWKEFQKGKMKKKDVLEFSQNLEKNLFSLHYSLKNNSYNHDKYKKFIISDPKRRIINKATVKDRITHHSIVRQIESFYDKKFIQNSFSSRKNKGLHKGVKTLNKQILKISKNNTKNIYYLKCDINKFFDSVNHQILFNILERDIKDIYTLRLIEIIINSFHVNYKTALPLGNYTSQIFSNIYLNELDQYIKRITKIENYFRYCDDFIILNSSKSELYKILNKINYFLNNSLSLKLHKNKIYINKVSKGVDFLGYVIFPNYRILRTKTKKRIMKKFRLNPNSESLASYVGMTKHANCNDIRRELNKIYFHFKK